MVAFWIADHQNPQYRGIKNAMSDRRHFQQDLKMKDFDRHFDGLQSSYWQENLFSSADDTLLYTMAEL